MTSAPDRGIDLDHIHVQLPYGRTRTVDQLLTAWEKHVARISAEAPAPLSDSTWGAHDYFAALHMRCFVHDAIRGLGAETLRRLDARLGSADEQLLRITEPDERGLVIGYGEFSPTPGEWWWGRIPRSGPVREELELWEGRAPSHADEADDERRPDPDLPARTAAGANQLGLHRFWFILDPTDSETPIPLGMGHGCGITAIDLDDACNILGRLAEGSGLPPVMDVHVDVDVSALDAGHVLPNMGPPNSRGVWFPFSGL